MSSARVSACSLLLVFLLMAIAPSLLLLIVGSDLIQQTVDRWFNVDVERILASSESLAASSRRATWSEAARTPRRWRARSRPAA